MSVQVEYGSSYEEFRQRLLRSLGRLTRLVEMDSPGPIIGNEMALALWYATGLCGENVWSALPKRITAGVRAGAGNCQECDARRPEDESGKFLCEACEKKQINSGAARSTTGWSGRTARVSPGRPGALRGEQWGLHDPLADAPGNKSARRRRFLRLR